MIRGRPDQLGLPWQDDPFTVEPPPHGGTPVVRLKMLPVRSAAQVEIDTRPPGQPRTRAECIDGPRPCPWTQCRYHLHAVDGDDRAGRRWRPTEARHSVVRAHSRVTCALDVVDAEPDGLQRKAIAKLMGVTKERVRQIEELAATRLRVALALLEHDKGRCGPQCPACQ